LLAASRLGCRHCHWEDIAPVTPLLSTTLLRTQSDERLLRLAAAGHDRAFEAIVERYRKPLMRHARRVLGDGPRIEDVVQAAFVSAWAALRDGADVRELRPWLYRIVHNGSLNALRRAGEDHAQLPHGLATATGPEADLERRDEMRRTLDAVAALPERQRAALLAIAVDGRAHDDVAAELGLTSGAVRQLVHRARTSLRSVATALTPGPIAGWAAGAAHDTTVAHIAEVAAGAGGAGIAGAALKAGALAVTAGVLVVAVPHGLQPHFAPHTAPAVARATAPTSTASISQPTRSHGVRRVEQAGTRRQARRVGASGRDRRSEVERHDSSSFVGGENHHSVSLSDRSGTDGSRDGGTTTTSDTPETSGSDGSGDSTPIVAPTGDGGGGTSGASPTTSGDDGGSSTSDTGTSTDGSATSSPDMTAPTTATSCTDGC
jgi:RNA polymerase sigma factor (sigma-70 family)